MKLIKLYHAIKPNFKPLTEVPANMDNFVHVASFQPERGVGAKVTHSMLEIAFAKTQNTPDLEAGWKLGTRSTAVGDLILVEDDQVPNQHDYHGVDHVGFNTLGRKTCVVTPLDQILLTDY